ncbi:hypothetical protein [Halomonas denitrificans]|nr:hypothetical protein [Halomonas denitrificans]
MSESGNALVQLMADDLAVAPPPGLEPLLDAIEARCGSALRAIVLYGSCRRNADLGNGLVDLMAVVDSYRAVHGTGPSALFNALLPPNVYYLEAGSESARLRCKFIIVSEATLARRTAGGLDAYFWARFTQPCRLVRAKGPESARRIAACRAAAARTFAREGLPLGNGTLNARDFWIRSIRATYGCELRPEPAGAAEALIDRDPAFWSDLSARALTGLEDVDRLDDDRFRIRVGGLRRLRGRSRWTLRKVWGRTCNVLRLLKAAGTFSNGIDYLVWKIERHSGVRIEPTERMRRHPRLAGLALLFRLWRTGALR